MNPCRRQRATNIGPLDKRLRVRRCEPCRIRRTKCDGRRPCETCKERSTTCRSQVSRDATQAGLFVRQDGPETPISTPERRFTSTVVNMECLALVRQFVGQSPSPISALFSTPSLLQCFREDSGIRTALACIANAYKSRGKYSAVIQNNGMFMESEQRELYATIQTRLQRPDPHLDQPLLLLAVLFCVLQLMSNRSHNIGLHLLDQVTCYIVQPRGPQGFSTDLDKSTLLLFRIFEGIGSLMRERRTALTDPQWRKTVVDVQKSDKAHNASLFECICTFIASMTKINAESHAWLDRNSDITYESGSNPRPMNCSCSADGIALICEEHLAMGQRIIREASELLESLDEFEKTTKESLTTDDPCYDIFLSHCLCLKIGTIRLFAHPAWQSTLVSKEMFQESRVLEHAHSALDHVERVMPRAGLEAVIFIDHLISIGIEMRQSLDRLRVMSLLDDIKRRGFVVAEVYIEDLQLAWKAVPPSRPQVIQKLLPPQ